MTPIASFAILATSLLGAVAAPYDSMPANSTSVVVQLNTTYSGYATYYDDQRHACPEIEYSIDEPVAAVSAAMFGSVEDGTDVCGKHVKVNLKEEPSKHYTFKVVDICLECDDTSLDFTKSAIEQFADSGLVAIDWELIEVPVAEKPAIVTTVNKYQTLSSKSTSKKSTSKKSTSKKSTSKKSTSKTFRGRGTWFSDTTGSCGKKFSQKDMIVALNEAQMGRMRGKGSKCGQKIRVKTKGSSKSVVVKVVDTCPHRYCSHGQLDLSQGAFKKLAPMSKGVLNLEWSFV